ncbi:response regulator [Reinekea blandensis]|uniref:histidine kinase n=1 Tax=Reinekea blandensis MED297 TaxID=314283 RepID=A4BDX6_9GAMM|nr:hybrid sensor histidine kinase/response regulator [Reinekea blandensis]EAR09735.1 histidine kinase DhkJ [Reinekea blandensis MED297]
MSLFFRPHHKAQKDRSILKRVDQTLSRQGLPSALLHFGLFIIIEWSLLMQAPTPSVVYLFGLALVVMAAWRFIMIAQFEEWYARGPARWRDAFILSGFLHAGIWSAYLTYRLATAPEAPILQLGILYTAAIAAGGTFVYSLYGKTVRLYLLVLLGPIAVFYFFLSALEIALILGIGFVAMYFYLVSTAHRVGDLVWSFLATNHEYKLRLSVLEQAREASTVDNKSNRRFIQQILMRVKNPLSGLLGVLSMLSLGDQDNENQGMLSIARRSGYSMLDLINDLEAFIEQRDQTRVPQSMVFNLRKTLEHAMADMGAKAHENGRELSYLYHPDVPERIEADPQWLSNAFRRLLDFTLDMAESGEITVRVGIDSEAGQEQLILTFYFINTEMAIEDLRSALNRQMDILPEDEDVADQLTLMVATAQFKAMGAVLSATANDDLRKIRVSLPISTTSQQASSFKPAKYMAGKSILLVDLSEQNERSLTAEFMSWNMQVAVWTLDRLLDSEERIETDFIFINVPVDDQKARQQLREIESLSERFVAQTHIVLYASELQRSLFADLNGRYTFVEKPVARDQLLSALRAATDESEDAEADIYRCENSRVLLAEDNLLNQKVVLRMLEQTGVQVDTCVNGREAIEKLKTNHYDLVLMDCYMPRLDGLEATRLIRKDEINTGQHIPIVAMTSEQTPEVERECLAAGMDDFLGKPLQRDLLVGALQRWTAD